MRKLKIHIIHVLHGYRPVEIVSPMEIVDNENA